jgi:IS30 family transposase
MDRIFSALESGETMTDICKRLGFDRSTIPRHIKSKPKFRNAHARAREAQADALADKAMQIANDGRNDTYVDSEGRQRVDYDNIRRSELRVRHHQWLCSKLAPHIYRDRAATLNVQ